MKKFKKVFTVILAIACLACVAIPASAATPYASKSAGSFGTLSAHIYKFVCRYCRRIGFLRLFIKRFISRFYIQKHSASYKAGKNHNNRKYQNNTSLFNIIFRRPRLLLPHQAVDGLFPFADYQNSVFQSFVHG